MDPIKALAATAAQLGAEAQRAAGLEAVLLCAVSALVRSHPDPAAFAREFRQEWLRLGSPNQGLPDDDQAGNGIAEGLAVLEQACSAPLGVRPPGDG